MARRSQGIKLQLSISVIFTMLIVPALGCVIAFSYYANLHNLQTVSQRFVDTARDDAITMSHDLLDPVIGVVRVVAGMAQADPAFFRTEESRNVLHAALISAPQIDAFYVSFEDGYHRVVTRIDADRRRSDPRIPANARWHSSYIDAYKDGGRRQRHRTFFEHWGKPIGGYSIDTDIDVRTLPHYVAAKRSGRTAITDPIINPDTGFPVLPVGHPIQHAGSFIGVVSAQITLDVLSKFLDSHKASPNSITVIADAAGNVIAHPVMAEGVRRVGGKIDLTKLSELREPQIVAAVAQRAVRHSDRFTFRAGPDGREYVALFGQFRAGLAKPWQVVVVAPTDDFVGGLKETNRRLVWIMLALAGAEAVLIYFMSRRIARPIETVTAAIERTRRLSFDAAIAVKSQVTEIAQLQRAVGLLANALRSFSVFVPVGLVRELVDSGRPLVPHVEPRFMTIFFSDVENFSTIAERMTPQELSEQTSLYFETVTSAIAEEHGTIDKFIGDSVMAFWGAPSVVDDHVFRACVAALKASRRMARRNEQWAAAGRKRMTTRIGIHCANVVVGNVGSPERLSYTVMGDGVNIASRLEGLNKQFGTSICISEEVYDRVAGRVVARRLERLAVKGRTADLLVYELLDVVGVTIPDLDPAHGSPPLAATGAPSNAGGD